MEHLVMQINYFCHASTDTRYITILVKNLAHKILEYLKIESKDIQHLLRHEKKHHHYKIYTTTHKSKHLHRQFEHEKENIKKNVQKIIHACQKRKDNKITRKSFLDKINQSCSFILKTLESEHHELDLIKKMISHQKKVIGVRRKITEKHFKSKK